MLTSLDAHPATVRETTATPGPLRVLHITTYANHGGAGRSAYRIHRELRRRGWTSRMLVARKLVDGDEVAPIWQTLPWRLADRICGALTDRLSLQYLVTPSSYRLAHHPWFRAADLVHLYNLHGGYFSYPTLMALSRQRPMVWHLADMWSMTGHCSYAYDCERWRTGCGACPMLRDATPLRHDTTALLWRIKRWVYQRSRLAIVVRSRWMGEQVQQSPLLRHFPMFHVPNSIDPAMFHPIPQSAARQLLGLPQEGRVLFFSAESVLDPRKGGALLHQALARIAGLQSVRLLVAGHGADQWEVGGSLPVHSLGYVGDQRILAAAYAAADVFLLPSRGDNAPNSLLESMACGTPAVAFDVGGCREMIDHMATGYLATPYDVEDFVRGIRLLVEQDALRRRMGEHGQARIAQHHTMTREVDRYIEVYTDVRARWLAAAQGRRA